MSENNCVFCKIISGVFSSTTVYEDDNFKAIFDISPASKGHTLVLAKKHVENIFEMDEAIAANGLSVISKIATAIKEALSCDGINIIQNNGEAAGQTVNHLHFHIIPRFNNDGVISTWVNKSYENDEANQIAERIKSKL